jgi:hypothetical protein
MDGEKTLDDILTEAAGGTPAPEDPAPEDPAPEDPAPEDPAPEDPAPEDPAPEDVKPQDKKPNPIKEVRDQLKITKAERDKIQGAIKRFTDGDYDLKLKDFKTEDGEVDYDALVEAMDDLDLKAKAESKGLAPEVQAEIERIEREKIELQKQKLQVSMDKALNNLQLTHKLDDAAVNNFFKDAMAVKMNPYQWLAQGGNLNQLYNTIYFDRLVKEATEKAVAEAKAKWDEAAGKGDRAPKPNPADPAPKNTTVEDGISLAKLLEDAASRK